MSVQSLEGMVFAGKYRINRLIGKGGMANVYLATDMGSGMKVAIKVLKPEFSADEEFIRRFDAEAKAVSSLNHSNIVKVFGVGHEGNFRFIVQEYVEGITVKELINQNGHLDWRVAVPITIQVAMALDYAHNNGIVHRDIKPQNILISRDRIAKITDFGIARAVSSGNTITMSSGGAMGSVHYFSPEQARGGNVGPGSDIYSIGVMLFEMVTGRVPFDGDSNVAIAVKHLQDPPPHASSFLPDVPNGLDSIITKCMQKTPDRRYLSMRQLVTELDALLVDPNGVFGIIDTGYREETPNVSFRQDPSYDRIDDIEKSAESRRRARLRDNILLGLIIACIVAVIIGGIVLVKNMLGSAENKLNENTLNEEKILGKYVGMTVDEAEAELKKLGLGKNDYVLSAVQTDEYPENVIISQSIGEGIAIKSQILTLEYATPEDSIVLQDYAGADFRIAQTQLENMHLNVSIIAEDNEEVESGKVLRTEPAAGTSVKKDDSIIIVYAKEPSSSTVPNVMGMNVREARESIEKSGLGIAKIEGYEEIIAMSEEDQIVMLTDPVSGTSVDRKSQIVLYVGSREDWANGGTPTPTPAMVTVFGNAEGYGTIQGAGEYLPNTQVTLTAQPADGYKFECWKDIWGNTVSVQPTYTFQTGESNASFTAVFSPLPTPTPVPTEAPPPPDNTQPDQSQQPQPQQ